MWTEEREALLTKLWAEGWSASEIALKLWRLTGMNTTRNAVIGKVHRLNGGGPRRPTNGFSPRSHQNFLALRKGVLQAASEKMTSDECVDLLITRYGITRSRSAVNKAARALGVRLRRESWQARLSTPEQRQRKRESAEAQLRRQRELIAEKCGEEPEPIGTKEPHECRWIHGDPSKPDWRYCSHPVAGNTSWCPHHYLRATKAPEGAAA